MTKIEWADKTWNPVTGCTPVSEGCHNCYARRMAKRLAGRHGYDKEYPFEVIEHPGRMKQPYRWSKPGRIFVCSMGDLFHEHTSDETIKNIISVMRDTPRHRYIVLTKRAERMKLLVNSITHTDPADNICLGVSAENNDTARERIFHLLNTKAAMRCVSFEPLLGPVNIFEGYGKFMAQYDISPFGPLETMLHWVIVGGETGPGSRPMQQAWATMIHDQCKILGVPFFFKRWGPKGKGRLLDGQEHNNYPEGLRC